MRNSKTLFRGWAIALAIVLLVVSVWQPAPPGKDVWLTEHFRLSEFVPLEKAAALSLPQRANLSALSAWLEEMRQHVGAIRVTSGCRTPEENARVGGVHNSLHMECLAADVIFLDYKSQAAAYARLASLYGERTPLDLVFEGDHTHLELDYSEVER